MNSSRVADVAPAVPLARRNRQVYTYRLPRRAERIPRYASVFVPFGRRTVPGVVVRLHAVRSARHLRAILSVRPAVLTKEQIAFAGWMARLAQGGLGYTLRLFLPDHSLPPPAPKPGQIHPATRRHTARTQRALINSDRARRNSSLAAYIRGQCDAGRQVAVIVPERLMAELLAHDLVERAPARYALVHAKLGARRLAAAWHNVRAGAVDVVVGTQKALFLPYRALGLIVIEEAGFETHKLWDQYPRLSNIYAAEMLADVHHASLIYTSTFPSLALQHAVAQGNLTVDQPHPLALRVAIVPYTVADRVQRLPLPHELLVQLRQWVARREQILLFYNRRRLDFLATVLQQSGFKTPREQFTLATSAVFTRRSVQGFGRIVWLWPETYLEYPDWRGPERLLLTAARLHQLLPARRQLFIVTRRQAVAELLERPIAEVSAELLAERRRLEYPPFNDLVRLSIVDRSWAAVWRRGVQLRQRLDVQIEKQGTSVKVRGPFHSSAAAPRRAAAAVHILLSGKLAELVGLYDGLPVAAAEVAPHQIV